ncbi:MAG: hypothetical protein RLZ11_1426 [Bacteroidota bacterium]|jgi:TrmH family RNA methyltransferase
MLVKTKIKDIQSLAGKKYRDETGLFLMEGPKLVGELLVQDHTQVKEIYALDSWVETNLSQLENVPYTVISEAELLRISQLATPNQVVASVKQFEYPPLQTKGHLTLVCCGIQDPGNFGTIIRTADWFGVQQLVCSLDTVDQYNPKVVQASMGSLGRVSIFYQDLDHWLSSQKNIPVFAAVLNKEPLSFQQPLQEGILLLGNESKGIPPHLLSDQVKQFSIPGKGRAESLNVAVATGILLAQLS